MNDPGGGGGDAERVRAGMCQDKLDTLVPNTPGISAPSAHVENQLLFILK